MGNNSIGYVSDLSDNRLTSSDREITLRNFAQENGWLPSYTIEYRKTEDLANGHIVVEHGLDTTAVISFLNRDNPFSQLSLYQQIDLLTISYNNLVDWHLFPDREGITAVYNRKTPLHAKYVSRIKQPNVWRVEAFGSIVEKVVNPNIKSLDQGLVDILMFWKKAIVSEMGYSISNSAISALFNSFLFVRAVEDQKRWQDPNLNRILLDTWSRLRTPRTIVACLKGCFRRLGTSFPRSLLDIEELKKFDGLAEDSATQLFEEFYKNKLVPYEYDFSLISKHAISKIYENYVSLLKEEDSPQLTLFADLPKDVRNRELGCYYTPQYIAKFFAKYLKENLTPKMFRELKIADPACGSGIFLRTVLEMQCEHSQTVDMREPTKRAFRNILGIDIDNNACNATRLSIALLHLILTHTLPRNLNIHCAETIDYLTQNHRKLLGKLDAVIANPPYIAWANIQPELQQRLLDYMEDFTMGKMDTYLAHIKIGFDMLKPGGFMLYVLPHSFLISKNAKKLRKSLAEKCTIRFIADLSEISVFGNVGTYTILLILQKKSELFVGEQKATVVRCTDFPGHALQLGLEGKIVDEKLYEIYKIGQETFQQDEWHLLPPRQQSLKARLNTFPMLKDFLAIKAGFNSGCNDVFIRDVGDIPEEEKGIYVPYLSDRSMKAYSTPKNTTKRVFYPYVGKKYISEADLRKLYPRTWMYLKSHSEELKTRNCVEKNECPWWRPERSRPPKNMMVPKLVSPHLILFPKFSLDLAGKFAISRAPLMCLNDTEGNKDILYYFLAVLNSSVVSWQIAHLSHKYNNGYFALEPKTLKMIRVPDPVTLSRVKLKQIQDLAKERITNKAEYQSIEDELNEAVAEIYDLTLSEQVEIGLGDVS